jgi:hypothetical protein
MKAVACLVWTYFTGSSATRWLTAGGLVLMLASIYVLLYLPQTEHMLALAWPGLIAFYFGSSLMPLTVGRLSQGRAASILPGARVKLLISVLATVLLAALPVGLLTPLAYVAGMSADVSLLIQNPGLFEYTAGLALITYTSACIAAAWLYVFMWFISSERGLTGYAKACAVLLLLVLVSISQDVPEGERLQSSLRHLAVLAVVFSTCFLAWPNLKRWFAARMRLSAADPGASAREIAGREIDLLLGNSRPWLLAAVLLLPLAIASFAGVGTPAMWLFYLAIASIVAGGNAERAPGRSRALWLRGGWSRGELFDAVERSAWRHNGLVLLALVLFALGISAHAGMTPSQMAAGIPLILIGTALSTYLGLMLTRGVRALESSLAVAVVMALAAIAAMATDDEVSHGMVAAALVALAAFAVVLRGFARRRWTRIDWSLCRGDAPGHVRG